jgi:hypothetical protein
MSQRSGKIVEDMRIPFPLPQLDNPVGLVDAYRAFPGQPK